MRCAGSAGYRYTPIPPDEGIVLAERVRNEKPVGTPEARVLAHSATQASHLSLPR